MLPSAKERRKKSPFFHKYYLDVCRLRNVAPISFAKHHFDKNTLDLSGDRLKIDDWLSILEALKNDRSLQFIAIRSKLPVKKVLDEANTESRVRSIKRHPVLLTRFVMRLLMVSLADCIGESGVITCLELQGLPLKLEYMSLISKGISTNSSLQTISFHSSAIGDEACEQLCLLIRHMLSVFHLDLSNCDLSCRSAVQIAEMLQYQSLQRYSEGWKQSLRYRDPNLQSMPGLRRIILNNNPQIGDKGLRNLAEVLKEDIWLKAIDLQNCGISNVGAQYVLDMLNINVTLYIVDVRDNVGIDNVLVHQIMLKLLFNNANKDAREYNWTIPQSLLPHCASSKPQHLIQKTGWRPNVSKKSISQGAKQKKVSNTLATNLELMKNTSHLTPEHYLSQLLQTKEKLTEVVKQLEKEIDLRRKAEMEQEELRMKINELENELLKEREEKEGFCFVKMEAYEAILETLENFSTFMEHIKEADEANIQEGCLPENGRILHNTDVKMLIEAHIKSMMKVAIQEEKNKLSSQLKKSPPEMTISLKLAENEIPTNYNFNSWRMGSKEDTIHFTERENIILTDVLKVLMSSSTSKDKPVTHCSSSSVIRKDNLLSKCEIPVRINTNADSRSVCKVTQLYEQFIEQYTKKESNLQKCEA